MSSDPYEAMWELEEAQCFSCRFRKNPDEDGQHAQEYPMCYEVEALLVTEQNLQEPLDEDEFGSVVCTKYLPGDPWETFGVHPEQPTLF